MGCLENVVEAVAGKAVEGVVPLTNWSCALADLTLPFVCLFGWYV